MKELEAIKKEFQSLCEEVERIIEKHTSRRNSIPVPDNICFEVGEWGSYLWNGERRLSYDKEDGGWDCVINRSRLKPPKMKLIPIHLSELQPGDWFVHYPEVSDLNKVDSYFLYLGVKESIRFNTEDGKCPLYYDVWGFNLDDNFYKVVPA